VIDMTRHALTAFLCLLAAPLAAQERLVLPSGLEVELLEVLWDEDVETGRFRFLAPSIAVGAFVPGAILDDMMVLCSDFALPVQLALRPQWDELVISFASAPSAFGVMTPDVVQFFEGFSLAEGGCIWSQF